MQNDTGMTSSVQDVAGQAKDAAGQMTGQIKQQATTRLNDQKSVAAQGLGSVASAVTQVGDQLRTQNPTIANVAETAATRIEDFSRSLEQRDITELLGEVERFARRQPLAFLGGAFAIGLLGARFLKSSNPNSFQGYPSNRYSGYSSGYGYTGSAGYSGTSSYPGYPDYNRSSGTGMSGGYPSTTDYDTYGTTGSQSGMTGGGTYGTTGTGTFDTSLRDTSLTGTGSVGSTTGSQRTYSPYGGAAGDEDLTDLTDTFDSLGQTGQSGRSGIDG